MTTIAYCPAVTSALDCIGSVGSRVKGTLHSKWIRIFERDTGLGKRGNESVESWPVNFLCQCYVRVMTDDGKQFVCYFDNLN